MATSTPSSSSSSSSSQPSTSTSSSSSSHKSPSQIAAVVLAYFIISITLVFSNKLLLAPSTSSTSTSNTLHYTILYHTTLHYTNICNLLYSILYSFICSLLLHPTVSAVGHVHTDTDTTAATATNDYNTATSDDRNNVDHLIHIEQNELQNSIQSS
jgi:hypothetical protein